MPYRHESVIDYPITGVCVLYANVNARFNEGMDYYKPQWKLFKHNKLKEFNEIITRIKLTFSLWK